MKIALHVRAIVALVDRFGEMEVTISQIAERVQLQSFFNESVIFSINGSVEKVQKHKTTSREWLGFSRTTNGKL